MNDNTVNIFRLQARRRSLSNLADVNGDAGSNLDIVRGQYKDTGKIATRRRDANKILRDAKAGKLEGYSPACFKFRILPDHKTAEQAAIDSGEQPVKATREAVLSGGAQ